MPIDLNAVGKKLGSVTHSYTQRDVMLYALGVGCGTDDLQFTYERELKVLPTFAVIPSFPAMLNLGGAMQVNPAMVLHGEQAIEVPAPIPTEGTVITTPTIKAVYDKGKGAVVVVGTESVDEKGKVLFRATSSIFVRGEGGFGGDRGPSGARTGCTLWPRSSARPGPRCWWRAPTCASRSRSSRSSRGLASASAVSTCSSTTPGSGGRPRCPRDRPSTGARCSRSTSSG